MKALFHWNIKRQVWLLLASLIAQVLFYNLPLLASHGLHSPTGRTAEASLGAYFLGMFALHALLVTILAARSFAFLHRQDDARLLLGFPLQRSQLWLSLILSDAALILASRLIGGLLNLLLLLPAGVPFAGILYPEIDLLLMSLACLAFWSFFFVISGRSFNALLYGLLLNLCWPLILFLLRFLAWNMLPGMPPVDMNLEHDISFFMLSPLLGGFALSVQGTAGQLAWLLFTIIFTFLSWLLFLRRPAERADTLDLQRLSFLPLRLLVSLTGGLGLGILFALIRANSLKSGLLRGLYQSKVVITTGGSYAEGAALPSNGIMPALWIGLAAGSFMACLLMDLFLSRGEGKVRHSLPTAALAFLLSAVMVLTLSWGFFDYTGQRPDPQKASEILLQQGREKCFLADSPESRRKLAELFEKKFKDGTPGLEIPRDFVSNERFRISGGSEDPGFVSQVEMCWQQNGRRHRRMLQLKREDIASLEELSPDPMARLFLNTLSGFENHRFVDSVEISNKSTLTETQKAMLAQFKEDQTRAESQGSAHWPFMTSGQTQTLIGALLDDYSRLSQAERIELDKNSSQSLCLNISVLENMEREKHGFSEVRSYELKDVRMNFPFDEDFSSFFSWLEGLNRDHETILRLNQVETQPIEAERPTESVPSVQKTTH